MADISITIDAKAVQQLLDNAPNRLETAIRGTLEDGASHFIATMKAYPAPRTGSTYRRTGTLARSWSVRPITPTSSGWSVLIGSSGNIAPYNRNVQDRERQARIHRGRWVTAQTATEQGASAVQRFADARIRAALGGI